MKMKKRVIQNQAIQDSREDSLYEIKFFNLQSFLARNYPEILEEYENRENERGGHIVYG